MTQIYTILFDLDGTIVNTAPDLMAAHNHVMKKFGHKEKKLSDISFSSWPNFFMTWLWAAIKSGAVLTIVPSKSKRIVYIWVILKVLKRNILWLISVTLLM